MNAAEPFVPPPGCSPPDGAEAVEFPSGLPGFPGARRFHLRPLAAAGGDFAELVSLEDPDLRLPLVLRPAGGEVPAEADLEEACRALGFARERVRIYFVVTLEREAARAWINLRAPVLVDPETGRGAQVVLADPRYPLRFPLPSRSDRPAA